MHRPFIFVTLVLLLTVMNSAETKADETIQVGLIQMNARLYDKPYNLERAEKLIREAAHRGAKIVCTPEAAVQGYARVDLPPRTPPRSSRSAQKSWRQRRRFLGLPQTALPALPKNWASGSYWAWMRIARGSCSTPRFS